MRHRVKPVNYHISFYDLKFEGDFSYHGSVKIDLEVKESFKEITLNAHQVTIERAEIEGKGKELASSCGV